MSLEEKSPVQTIKAVNKKNKTIMIIAGEASGDMHGANLVREMLKIRPGIEFLRHRRKQIAGRRSGTSGQCFGNGCCRFDRGCFQIRKYFKNNGMMKKSLDERRPDLVILIDYPDFNLPISQSRQEKRNKSFYYISPQVWAWRKGRIGQIKKTVNKMAVILPFEVDTYSEKGFAVNYVGHPLLDLVKPNYSKQESRKKFGLAEDKITIGILPGSRLSEVRKLLPEMLRAAEILKDEIPDMQFVLPLADTLEETSVTEIISRFNVKVKVISGHTYDVISCADLAFVASGTATLETALLGVPMIIVYKISLLSYFIGRLIS